ncbi:IclR family transcriptional regulator [Paralcaligenes sp. KSB-10]|jgi:DNA-binding IclR family transcriptional regulator|uniref:IclR family transcriptional regulator n=1 Tax=Paralcaligenes sp. KSB-10 TaxID=2901142 RepID=UPI001E65819D|nr:IclR family transcriptional regulator [Paralcaligenes sp. KSB-10]UHL63461.1 IclR family transcriptional regulator [Paralcaligenes sp. KSB-10]
MANERSVISRVSTILNLFGEHKPLITIDEIAQALDASPASAYRYAADLVEAGLLSRLFGRYRLGLKLIELEYLISTCDPIIAAAHDLMDALARATGANVLLCNMYDHTLVNVAHVTGVQAIRLRYTKGLPMPLFRGSQAHVVVAHMERRRLKRLYEASLLDPLTRDDAMALGGDWKAFSRSLRQIRSQGYYISRGELDKGVVGIAAPVFGEHQEILGSLVLVTDERTPLQLPETALIELVVQNARQLSQRIEQLA